MPDEKVAFVVVVQATITDPIAVSATDVSTVSNPEAGTVDPYIPPANLALHGAVMQAVAAKIQSLPGAKWRGCSVLELPKADDGSYAPLQLGPFPAEF